MAHHLIRVSGSAVSFAAIGMLSTGALAGPLDPPSGPVAPTMKPLDAIEPRICINDLPGSQEAVHVITEPGNYYLRADITGEVGKHGIHIDLRAHDTNGCPVSTPVRCSLNGFALTGVPGSDDAVHVSGSTAHDDVIYIIGGRDAGMSSITCWGGDGLDFEDVEDITVSGVSVLECDGNGFRGAGEPRRMRAKVFTNQFSCDTNGILIIPPSSGLNSIEIANVDASGNGFHGLHIDWASSPDTRDGGETRIGLNDLIFDHNGGDGMRSVSDNRRHSISMLGHELHASGNLGDGVRITGETLDLDESMDHSLDFDGLTAHSNGGCGARIKRYLSHVNHFFTRSNGEDGIQCEDALLTATDGRSSRNGGHGLYIFGGRRASVRNADCSDNGTGPTGGSGIVLEGASVEAGEHIIADSSCSNNADAGIQLVDNDCPTRMTDVMMASNGGDGLLEQTLLGLPTGKVHLSRCIAQSNAENGFYFSSGTGGVIQHCVADANTERGIVVFGTGFVVISNVISANVQGTILTGQNNTVAPSVDDTQLATNSNPHANLVR